MTAFAVYARPQDRLVHLIVHPASAERDPDFFYPHAGSEARVHRVDVPFPRLRSLLASSPVGVALEEGADLRGLLAEIQPHLDAERVPDALSLSFYDGYAELSATGPDIRAMPVRLTPAQAATLAVVAEAIAEGGGRTRLDALAVSPPVEAQRTAVIGECGRYTTLTPWTASADVSKAVSRLNAALSESPLVARFASIESDVHADATEYRWAEPLEKPLTLSSTPESSWPFRRLG